MQRRLIVVLASLVLAFLVVPVATSASPVLSPTATQFGKTYGQWSASWWQWALGTPVHAPPRSTRIIHPLVDLTGARCGVGQSGPVWFLGGAFFEIGSVATSTIVRNDCVVPRGKALFFPSLNVECTQVEGPGNGCGATEEESRAIVTFVADLMTNLAADVDGSAISVTRDFRVGSPAKPSFCVSLPPDDLLSWIGEGPGGFGSGTHFSPGDSCPTVDDGYYVMLAPLSTGRHVVHFHGEVPDFGVVLDVTYKLTVQ